MNVNKKYEKPVVQAASVEGHVEIHTAHEVLVLDEDTALTMCADIRRALEAP